jgi:hypothetical protein
MWHYLKIALITVATMYALNLLAATSTTLRPVIKST